MHSHRDIYLFFIFYFFIFFWLFSNGSRSNASIVPFAVDTLGNFCSVAITFLKAIAKTKFAKISNKAEVKELAASNWISTTCRDIQTAIIKTCAYNNRFALKCAFGESYNVLYPGTIYSPPSYDVRFPSAIMSSWYYLFTFIGIFDYENINTLVWDRLFQLFYSFEE